MLQLLCYYSKNRRCRTGDVFLYEVPANGKINFNDDHRRQLFLVQLHVHRAHHGHLFSFLCASRRRYRLLLQVDERPFSLLHARRRGHQLFLPLQVDEQRVSFLHRDPLCHRLLVGCAIATPTPTATHCTQDSANWC